uniref:Chromosome 1 open reading frame 43 n=1 Tax=Suricata suricatta TaxID=37032 RepID=A0A673TG29_SURSU
MASGSNWLSGVNVVLVMAYGSLVFVLLFIFVKRQIMRFAMKSRRGPHVPVGHNAPKDLKEEIDIRLSRVQDIKYEPQLLADGDARLLQLEVQGGQSCYNYLYRMKALDAIRASEIPFHAEGRHPRSLMGKNFRSYLLDLRNTSTPFKGVRKALIDTLLDGYETARYGTGVSGAPLLPSGDGRAPRPEGAPLLLPLPSGLWPERVPALPGGPERAGRRVSGGGGAPATCPARAVLTKSRASWPVLPCVALPEHRRGSLCSFVFLFVFSSAQQNVRISVTCRPIKGIKLGNWGAQSVKCPTFAQVMISQSVGLSPTSGSVLTARSLHGILSPCLSAPPLFMLSLSLFNL